MSLILEQIEPGPTDRAVLVGQTGCGKTTLARVLLERRRATARILIFDWKGTIKWPGYKRYTKLKKLVEANAPHAIYAPDHREMIDPAYIDAFYNYAFLKAERDYKRGRRIELILYTDESFGATLEGRYFPPMYSAAMTRGREFLLSAWSSTQLPVSIPSRILTEAEHYYVFYLKNPDHRDKIEKMTGLESEKIFALKKRFFYHADAEGNVSPKLTLKLKRAA